MIYELIVTSAKRALQAGRSGFAAVMRTRGMHPELQSRLEALSGYRHLHPQGDPRNPVIQAHCVVDSVAGKFSVFSRTTDAGSDYSGRSNKLSHHFACDASDIRGAGRSSPAATLKWLADNNRFASRWEDDPREQDPPAPVVYPPSDPAKCSAWESIAGDAGWAGVLVNRTLKGVPTWIIVAADVDPITLFIEALAIMDPARRWDVSFTTHAISQAGFLWNVAVDGSPEAKLAREHHAAAVIDITRSATASDDGPYVQAARGLAEVPWKKSGVVKQETANKPATPVLDSPSDRNSGVAPVASQREPAVPPPTSRPAPPPLVKPPPVGRPADTLADALPLPKATGRSFLARGHNSLIAAAIAFGLAVTVCLGLLLDERLRGERSVVRKVAVLVGQVEGNSERTTSRPQSGNSQQKRRETHVPRGGAGSKQTSSRGTQQDSQKKNQSEEHASEETPSPSSPATDDSDTTPDDVEVTAVATPRPNDQQRPKKSADAGPSSIRTDDDATGVAGSFETIRAIIATQNHLPVQPLSDGSARVEDTETRPVMLVRFKQGTALPTIERLALLQSPAGPETSDTTFTLEALPAKKEGLRWACRHTRESEASKEVGVFLLNEEGLSFVPVAATQDLISRLATCCLLVLGKDSADATYLQLSHPITIPPVPFTLEPGREDVHAVLQADVPLPAAGWPGGVVTCGGDVSLTINGATASDTPAFALECFPFEPPLAGHFLACLPVGEEKLLAPLDYRVTTDGDVISLRLRVNPFADKTQWDRVCAAVAKGSNVNFEQTFWPYARSELAEVFPDELQTGGKETRKQQVRLFGSLQEKLRPSKKPAAPFATYVESVKNVLLSSPTLVTRAERIVDEKHPPTPAAKDEKESTRADKDPGDKDGESVFDREAEITAEKESLFTAWCEERIRQIERQLRESGPPGEATWTDEDLGDYAALLLWSRVQYLEKCVQAFGLPKDPKAVEGTAHFELKRVWPEQMIPKGVSCLPESLLLRTTE